MQKLMCSIILKCSTIQNDDILTMDVSHQRSMNKDFLRTKKCLVNSEAVNQSVYLPIIN